MVGEGCRFASGQFVFAHKQMDVDAQSGVANDLLAALAARVGGVLALPVKVAVIDPVVHVFVFIHLALFVDRDQQDVSLFRGQHHMADISVAGVECFRSTVEVHFGAPINYIVKNALIR